MNHFYGEIVSINKDEFKAANEDGAEFTSPINNIPESIIPHLRLGTNIRFDDIRGNLFYKKGKSRAWTLIKNVFETEVKKK